MSIFKELIQQDYDVCSNCFRENYDRFEVKGFLNEGTVYPVRESLKPVISDKTFPKESIIEARGQVSEGKALACQCGVLSPHTTIRPIQQSDMIDYAHNLRHTLENKGVSFDHDVFYDTIRDLKSEPSEQGNDDRIFERAVERAVDRECHK